MKNMSKPPVLGFIGLGVIGFSICCGLYRSGYSLVLPTYRRSRDENGKFTELAPDATAKHALYEEMLQNGAAGAENVADLARKSDYVLLCLPTSAQVEDVILGDGGVLANARPGTVVIDFTSADAESTRRLSKKLEENGIDLLDAPVSGGVRGAIAQTLSIIASGKDEVFQRCRPILEAVGNPEHIYHVGPSGAGDALKSINNYLSALAMAATTEAMAVAAKAGIDPREAARVISASGGKNDATQRKFPNYIFEGKRFGMQMRLMCKDIALFNQMANAYSVPALLGNTTYQIWKTMAVSAGEEQDMTRLVEQYEAWCGIELMGISDRGKQPPDK